MAFEVLALAFWIAIGVLGVQLLVTGRRTFFGLPKWPKDAWPLRVFGLVYVLMPGSFIYRAIHDGSFAPDGVVVGYAVLIGVALAAIYRRQMARRAQAADRV